MFKKILIANRGEIACRVIKTCRRLGIATVAVYSEADARALHVEMADEAYLIGAPEARESYLNAKKILEVARQSGVEAVHPGYGFLSENTAFARAAQKAGIVFIGPPPKAIEAMGEKSRAKKLMEKAGVPLVPGYHGDDQSEKTLLAAAKKIGFPVLLKASAGGGGKGMRVVEREKDFSDALASAKREAKAGFGNDEMLVEKYLTRPRHVEIQVFSDSHGNHVYLFERDCSIQRRHQKVIEEAPAPGMAEKLRKQMGEAAVAAAKAVNYEGAGTVEFLLDEDGSFYFMEMNTRLQVEHPVTEMITGLDLVEWQLHIANGGKLPLKQAQLKINGHAFEARIYAEDPANDFLPGAGRIDYLVFPEQGDHIRIDTGVREATTGGDTISIYYDPMIAKLIVWGKDRKAAIVRLQDALRQTRLAGLKNNVSFLLALAEEKDFGAGKVSTGFIAEHSKSLMAKTSPKTPLYAALYACAGLLLAKFEQGSNSDFTSPWNDFSNWRAGGSRAESHVFTVDGKETVVTADHYEDFHARMAVGRNIYDVHFYPEGECGALRIVIDGREVFVTVLRRAGNILVLHDGQTHVLQWRDPLAAGATGEEAASRLTAPMPGKIVAVHVKKGDKVEKGMPLIVLEAMKMEHTITAPANGIISAVNAGVGDQVDEKLELVSFK